MVLPTKITAELTSLTASRLSDAIQTYDIDKIYQVIGGVTGSLNNGNCSVAPNCTALNRSPCTSVKNTCGPCLSGYLGLAGNANTACAASKNFRNIGESCSSSRICISNLCVRGRCTSSAKECPHNCSGAGTCLFYDANGERVDFCDSNSLYCQAKCTCNGTRYGRECSLSYASYESQRTLRSTLCEAFHTAGDFQVNASDDDLLLYFIK